MTKPFEFIKGIFGDDIEKKEAQPLFCGFPDDPGSNKSWSAKAIENKTLPNVIKKENNNYFTPAVFCTDPEGKHRAKKDYFVAGHAIFIDDIGTKVKSSKIKMPLSWKIQTSPGNYQGGYILDIPCTDRKLFEAVINAMAEKKLTDPGSKGAARWMRMPLGRNTKEEYLVDGVAPKVKLVIWHPERRYSINQIIKAFGLKIDSNLLGSNDTSQSDKVLAALQNAGLWKSMLEAGKHDITCPWAEQHSKGVDHGTIYFEPNADNNLEGGFKCQHGHCSTRNISDLKAFLGITSEQPKKKLLEVALEFVDNIPAFCDENGDPFVFLNGSCHPVRSKEVKANISRKVYVSTRKPLRQNLLAESLAALESRAICDGEQIKLNLRIAQLGNHILYDLGDGRAVKTGKKKWTIVEAPPLFRRYKHQQVQVEPERGGDLWQLFDFLNIPKSQWLETIVMFISYLVPGIAHPIFHLYGPHGSAKSTLFKIVKSLIDPSSIKVMITPKSKQEVVRAINHHHMPHFDNMSKIDSELSDILCTACTGGGIPKRALYTDDDDHIFNFQSCIGINGINLVISKPDLLDRTMLLHVNRISKENRRLEKEVLNEFEAVKPEILGGMFDVLLKAMSIYPNVKLKELPRLADYATWGYAIAEALGEGKGNKFITAYQANVDRQLAEVMQHNSLCLAVTLLMEGRKKWTGTVQKAYVKLYNLVSPSKTDGTFPKDAKNLRKQLELIHATLAEAENISYRFSDRTNKGYSIAFVKKK
ncbi:MAG: hypothetical protein FD174_610 [Geobacteraceae bacterium]|nr:MAG: hypothetical protein FD174_610 [Geobacteraceae bacterium]